MVLCVAWKGGGWQEPSGRHTAFPLNSPHFRRHRWPPFSGYSSSMTQLLSYLCPLHLFCHSASSPTILPLCLILLVSFLAFLIYQYPSLSFLPLICMSQRPACFFFFFLAITHKESMRSIIDLRSNDVIFTLIVSSLTLNRHYSLSPAWREQPAPSKPRLSTSSSLYHHLYVPHKVEQTVTSQPTLTEYRQDILLTLPLLPALSTTSNYLSIRSPTQERVSATLGTAPLPRMRFSQTSLSHWDTLIPRTTVLHRLLSLTPFRHSWLNIQSLLLGINGGRHRENGQGGAGRGRKRGRGRRWHKACVRCSF